MENSSTDQDSEMEVAAEELVGIFPSGCPDTCLVDLKYYEDHVSKNKALKDTNGDISDCSLPKSESSNIPKPKTVLLTCGKASLGVVNTQEHIILPNNVSPTPTTQNVTETPSSPVLKSNKKKISLQSYQLYRRELGAQIHNMKASEKIGIKVSKSSFVAVNVSIIALCTL